MERELLLSVKDWQIYHSNMVNLYGGSIYVRNCGNDIVPKEYPCIVVKYDDIEDSFYDFIYKSEVEKMF